MRLTDNLEHIRNAELTIWSWDSPIPGKGSTSRKNGNLARHEPDGDVSKNAVYDLFLHQPLPIDISY
jgi:hypothetical protein